MKHLKKIAAISGIGIASVIGMTACAHNTVTNDNLAETQVSKSEDTQQEDVKISEYTAGVSDEGSSFAAGSYTEQDTENIKNTSNNDSEKNGNKEGSVTERTEEAKSVNDNNTTVYDNNAADIINNTFVTTETITEYTYPSFVYEQISPAPVVSDKLSANVTANKEKATSNDGCKRVAQIKLPSENKTEVETKENKVNDTKTSDNSNNSNNDVTVTIVNTGDDLIPVIPEEEDPVLPEPVVTETIDFIEITEDIITENTSDDVIEDTTDDVIEDTTEDVITEDTTEDVITEDTTEDVITEDTSDDIIEDTTDDIIEDTTDDVIGDTTEESPETNETVPDIVYTTTSYDLSPDAAEIYSWLVNNLINYNGSDEILTYHKQISLEDYESAWKAVEYDHVKYDAGPFTGWSSIDNPYIDIKLSQKYYKRSVYVQENIDRIVKEIYYPGMSEDEAILNLDNWFRNNFTYVNGVYNIHDALENNGGVCMTYALLAEAICDEMGIECCYSVGDAYNGTETGGHAWNHVKINGTWYWVDFTWDKELPEYYLSETLWDDHFFDEEWSVYNNL